MHGEKVDRHHSAKIIVKEGLPVVGRAKTKPTALVPVALNVAGWNRDPGKELVAQRQIIRGTDSAGI